MAEAIAPMLVGVAFFVLIGWVVYVIVDGRRRAEQIKAATDFHTRIIDRMGSAKEFSDFAASDAGRVFLDSLAPAPIGAKAQLLRSVQTGLVLFAVGLTAMVSGMAYNELSPGMTVIGALVAACGVGFLVSTVVAHRMSKAFGLLDDTGHGRR